MGEPVRPRYALEHTASTLQPTKEEIAQLAASDDYLYGTSPSKSAIHGVRYEA